MSPHTVSKLSVLVVDDEPELLKLIDHFLWYHGFVVDTVDSGRDALSAMAAIKYDVVLCDKNLPDIHGLQVLVHARRLQPHAAVVLMTAWPELVSLRDLDLDGYLPKPFRSGQDLADSLREAVERKARRSGQVPASTTEDSRAPTPLRATPTASPPRRN
ncbi:MAG: hypothetical protein AMXMBFR34_52240 [Myxococcaceae bacterium]